MTYEELIEWVEDNAERFSNEGDMIAGIHGYDRLPGWVKNDIHDIWETFHALEEEEYEDEEEPPEEEFEEKRESLFSRFLRWVGL